MAASGKTKAEQVGDSAGLEVLARVGLIAYGVVYLLIGGLALQLAWGAGPSKSPDPSGAFRTLAEQPLGNVLLWLVAVGLVALGLWRASDVFWGHRALDGAKRVRKRVGSGVRAVVYTGLGVRSALVAAGFGAGSSIRSNKPLSVYWRCPVGGRSSSRPGSSSSASAWSRQFGECGNRSARRSTLRPFHQRPKTASCVWVKSDMSPKVWPSEWSAVCSAMRRGPSIGRRRRGWTEDCRRSLSSPSEAGCSVRWLLDSWPSACLRCCSSVIAGCKGRHRMTNRTAEPVLTAVRYQAVNATPRPVLVMVS